MHQTINGWTKEKMIETIYAGNKGKCAVIRNHFEQIVCSYLTEDGNKCAVGCFIPDGHIAQTRTTTAGALLADYPDLVHFMPLEIAGLIVMQKTHDQFRAGEKDPRPAIKLWIENNVEDVT